MEAGRPEGDGAAAAVLDGLLKMDALVRQSVESTHVPPPYVERLSAVYGKSALEIKVRAFPQGTYRVENITLHFPMFVVAVLKHGRTAC